MSSKIIIENDDLNLELDFYKGKRPYIFYNEKKYDAYLPGEIMPEDKNKTPIPKGIYGFVIDEYVLFITTSIFTSIIKILNPGYTAYFKESKAKGIIIKVISGIILLSILITGIIYLL